MVKLCRYCKQEMNEERLLDNKIFVCRNDNCIYCKTNTTDDSCKRYTESQNGKQINYETCKPSSGSTY